MLAGCGDGGDPYERGAVKGTVTLDGEPVEWGELYFKGEVDENDQVAQAYLEITNGKFESSGRATPGVGPNKILVTIYRGEKPAEDSDEAGEDPKVRGYYVADQTVAADGAEIKLEIKKSDLKRKEPEI